MGGGRRHRADPRPRPDHRRRGRWKSPAWTATPTHSRRGTPSCWPTAPRPTGRPSRGFPTLSTGARGRRPRPRRSPDGWPSWAAAWPARSSPRPLPASGRHGHAGGPQRAAGQLPGGGRGAGGRRAARRRRGAPPRHQDPAASARTTTAPSPSTLGGGDTVTVDKLLVATGRHPALEGLGLESVGLAAADGKPLTAQHRLHRPGQRTPPGTTTARGCTPWATPPARPC